MNRYAVVWLVIAGIPFAGCSMSNELDYSQMVHLDAESLGEGGIKEAYQNVLPRLRQFVNQPAIVEEQLNANPPSYAVICDGKKYVIYESDLPNDEGQSWQRATFAFFNIVNRQLTNSSHRFYAINSENDLGGMFLTAAEWEAAKRSLPNKSDWPYLPTEEGPWFGQFH